MRRVTWTENDAQIEGWFHGWATLSDSDGQSVHAIVEMDDGIVCTPQVWHGASLRFVTPHKPEIHHLADDGLDAARNHEPCSVAEIETRMERTAQEWDIDEAQRDHERHLEQLEMDAGTVSDD